LECGGSTPPCVAEEIPAMQDKYAKTINPAEKAASNSLFVSRATQLLPTGCAGRETRE
jgi:hypothetical protein